MKSQHRHRHSHSIGHANTSTSTNDDGDSDNDSDRLPSKSHWLMACMQNLRLVLQAVLKHLPCQARETFFKHLRRQKIPHHSPLPQAVVTTVLHSQSLSVPMPHALARSKSCNDVAIPRPVSTNHQHHAIEMPHDTALTSYPSEDRGEDCLRMLLSTLSQSIIHIPVTSKTDEFHCELLALYFCLLESHDQDACLQHLNGSVVASVNSSPKPRLASLSSSQSLLSASNSHQTFLVPLMTLAADSNGTGGGSGQPHSGDGKVVPSKLAFRLMHSLLLHYSLRASQHTNTNTSNDSITTSNTDTSADFSSVQQSAVSAASHPKSSSSALYKLFCSTFPLKHKLTALMKSPMKKALQFFFPPSTQFPLADRSALLALWLSYQFGINGSLKQNPFRQALAFLNDNMDRRGRIRPSLTGSLSFESLYISLSQTSSKEWSACFLFHLLNINTNFRSFVIRHPSLTALLLPLLHVLYTRYNLNDNFVYMIINIFLVLSQDKEFSVAMKNTVVSETVPFIKGAKVKDVSMHDLLLIVLYRVLHCNLEASDANGAGPFGFANCIATLSNMSAATMTDDYDGSDSGSSVGSGVMLTRHASSPTLSLMADSPQHDWCAFVLVDLFLSTADKLLAMIEQYVSDCHYSQQELSDSVDTLLSIIAVYENVCSLLLDSVIHYLLPVNLVNHQRVVAYLTQSSPFSLLRRLHGILKLTSIRMFYRVCNSEDSDEVGSDSDEYQYDLLGYLLDFLLAFEHCHDSDTHTHASTNNDIGSRQYELEYEVSATVVESVSHAVLSHLRTTQSSLSNHRDIPCTPWPFDPLALRGSFCHEERDASCQYFWPLFRKFAYRLGVGKLAGSISEATPAPRAADTTKTNSSGGGKDDISDEEVQRILRSFEDGAYDVDDDLLLPETLDSQWFEREYQEQQRREHDRQQRTHSSWQQRVQQQARHGNLSDEDY